MIARMWTGTTTVADAAAYVAHLREHTFPALAQIEGHRRACALRQTSGASVRFVVLTFWDSIDSIRRFAGDDAEAAVIPPEARALLESYDPRASHWEVSLDNSTQGGAK